MNNRSCPPDVVGCPEGYSLLRLRRAHAALLSEAIEESLETLRPWMPWVSAEPLAPSGRAAMLQRYDSAWEAGDAFHYGIFREGQLLGACSLHAKAQPGVLHLGYWVRRREERQGIATASARTLTTVALQVFGISAVEIHHDKANTVSSLIPARLGYELSGEIDHPIEAPGHTGTTCVWRMTLDDWPPVR